MAVHLPLSPEAQAEARLLMLSSNNILKPSDGRAVAVPSQDMVIGLNHLSDVRDDVVGIGNSYSSLGEAIMAMDAGLVHLNATITVGVDNFVPSDAQPAPEGWQEGERAYLQTTIGRVLFNQLLPADYPWVEVIATKGTLGELVNDLAERYPLVETARALDNLKDAGFYWGTRSGVTVAISDITSNFDKASIMETSPPRRPRGSHREQAAPKAHTA